jgi:FkbM family methyltransferase
MVIDALNKALKKIDSIFTAVLDKFEIPTINRIPCNFKSGACGPVNPGREHLSDAIIRLLKKRQVTGIVDCGAFEGHMSRMYSQMFPKATIYAFEPVPETFAILKQSSMAYPNIKTINKGAGSSSGRALFYETNHTGSSSMLPPSATGLHYYQDLYVINNQYEISVTTIDDWWQSVNRPDIQFIKLDVQGGELEVLKGAAEVLHRAKVELIQAEVTFMETYSRQCLFSDLEIFLRHQGFSFYQFYEIWTHPDGHAAGGDALFIKVKK